jgi:hypothetical protein
MNVFSGITPHFGAVGTRLSDMKGDKPCPILISEQELQQIAEENHLDLATLKSFFNYRGIATLAREKGLPANLTARVLTMLSNLNGVGVFYVDDEGTSDQTDYLVVSNALDSTMNALLEEDPDSLPEGAAKTLAANVQAALEPYQQLQKRLIARVLEQFAAFAIAGQD